MQSWTEKLLASLGICLIGSLLTLTVVGIAADVLQTVVKTSGGNSCATKGGQVMKWLNHLECFVFSLPFCLQNFEIKEKFRVIQLESSSLCAIQCSMVIRTTQNVIANNEY